MQNLDETTYKEYRFMNRILMMLLLCATSFTPTAWGAPPFKVGDEMAPQARVAGSNVVADNGPGNPAAPWQPMKPIVGGSLTETVIKKLIEDSVNKPVHHDIETVIVQFNSVNIAGPARFDIWKADLEGIPPTAIVRPVRADFNYTVQSIKYPADKSTTDRIGYAYFYQDEFKQWTFSWYAHTGQLNKVRQ